MSALEASGRSLWKGDTVPTAQYMFGLCSHKPKWFMKWFIFLNPHPRTCLLILEGGHGRVRERERNMDVRGKHPSAASCTHPNWGLSPQARYVPWLGIEPADFQFTGWCSDQPSHTSQGWNGSDTLRQTTVGSVSWNCTPVSNFF